MQLEFTWMSSYCSLCRVSSGVPVFKSSSGGVWDGPEKPGGNKMHVTFWGASAFLTFTPASAIEHFLGAILLDGRPYSLALSPFTYLTASVSSSVFLPGLRAFPCVANSWRLHFRVSSDFSYGTMCVWPCVTHCFRFTLPSFFSFSSGALRFWQYTQLVLSWRPE